MPMTTYTARMVRLFGKNPAIASSEWENLNDISERVRFEDIEGIVQLSSSSTDDVANTGTGAWTVLVIGLSADKSRIVQELISLNGRTPVSGTIDFSRVFQIEVVTAGTEKNNVGDIYCSEDGTAVANGIPVALTTSWCKMLATEGIATSGVFTVPAGKRYTIVKVQSTCLKQNCAVAIRVKDTGAADSAYKNITSYTMGASVPIVVDVPRPEDTPPIGELVDIYLVAKAEAAGASVHTIVYLLDTSNHARKA